MLGRASLKKKLHRGLHVNGTLSKLSIKKHEITMHKAPKYQEMCFAKIFFLALRSAVSAIQSTK